MKIAIGSDGRKLDDRLSDTFGRSPFFIIVQLDNKQIKQVEVMENVYKDTLGGAGIAVAQAVVEKGVQAVISVNIGPRAMTVLKQFKIKTYQGKGSVKACLQQFIQGKLVKR